jgi:Protein of unknown function (DUF2905)
MSVPKLLVSLGLCLVIVGVFAHFAPKAPWIYAWFGRLPGDIRYEGERTFFYAPITSMLVVSGVLSCLVSLVQRVGR